MDLASLAASLLLRAAAFLSGAGRDGADLVAVAALGLAREVGDQPGGPGLGRRYAGMRDHRRQHRLVVDAVRRAHADAAPPFGPGERLIGRKLGGRDPVAPLPAIARVHERAILLGGANIPVAEFGG